jgi:2'-5' RNA ligase
MGSEAAGGRSAVVVAVRLPERLKQLRQRHDPLARLGVPPHLTLLFPFLPAQRLMTETRRRLADVAAAHDPFVLELSRVGAFPDALYLAPRPDAPIRSLAAAVCAAFPDYPPYGGRIAPSALVPHLTMALPTADAMGDLTREMEALLPVHVRVDRLTVISEGQDGRWGVRWRLRLGRRR